MSAAKKEIETKTLQIKSVSKSFNEVEILNDISFSVSGGESFGLLGPNGAGKTTLLRMIMNIIAPDSGEILYNDIERQKLKAIHFGYLPEERGLYPRASVIDTLVYFGTLNNLTKRKAEVEAIRYLDRLGIVDYSDTRLNQLSKGMQQKVQFIAAFLHDPDVLILDEPFSGLDPINQIVLRDILKEYKEKRKILVISTHQMELAENMSDHICFLNQGKIILDGKVNDIRKRFRENAFLIEADEAMPFLKEIPGVEILTENNRSYKFHLDNKNVSIKKILEIVQSKIPIRRFEIVEPNLHDIFIRIIQEQN